eukprot:12057069-Karenia_brevis.AAC.1
MLPTDKSNFHKHGASDLQWQNSRSKPGTFQRATFFGQTKNMVSAPNAAGLRMILWNEAKKYKTASVEHRRPIHDGDSKPA